MRLDEFTIGGHFFVTGPEERPWKYRVTDVGTRVVVAIRVDHTCIYTTVGRGQTRAEVLTELEAERKKIFSGPPYMVLERLFDEDEQEICYPSVEAWKSEH